MLPDEAARELDNATDELLAAAEAGLEAVESSLARRSLILARVADMDPASFSPADLSRLRSALKNGEAALERLSFVRRDAAARWQRSTGISFCGSPNEGTVSLSA